jgi:hypothetical protein
MCSARNGGGGLTDGRAPSKAGPDRRGRQPRLTGYGDLLPLAWLDCSATAPAIATGERLTERGGRNLGRGRGRSLDSGRRAWLPFNP